LGLLDRFRGKPTQKEDNTALEQLSSAQVYTRKQSSAQEAEDRQNKGIDIDMIDPKEVIEELQCLAHYETETWEDTPITDNDGNVVFEKVPLIGSDGQPVFEEVPVEANGLILLSKRVVMVSAPKMGKKLVHREFIRGWADAALGYLNKVWPCIWMTPFEADTTRYRIRTGFHDIRKSMSYEDKKRYGVFLHMIRDLCLARCEDMKDGHKPLLVKVRLEENK
jgi:hypothetical protein